MANIKSSHNINLGRFGEEKVAHYLSDRRYEILDRNWRCQSGEIDLIAALGKATIVIEASARSGSIRTATDAAQIFRPVFAVPGRISSAQSDGCHRLIADHVAEIVTGVDDVINLLSPIQPLLDETMTQ